MDEGSPKHSKSSTEDQPLAPSSSTAATQLQLASFPFTTRDLLREDEMHEVLQLSSSQVSQATACNASALVQLSNAERSHERLQQLLPLYFYSWNLTDSHSVVVFLLLHYFLLKREHREALGAKGLYEEHIALLKTRMSDLEEKLSNSQSPSSGSRNGNSGGSGGRDQLLAEVESLRDQVESLKSENKQLKLSHDEVCRINEQWALDYQSLSDQVKNATGFYSVHSSGSSGPSSTRASPVPASMFTQACLQCSQMELRLEAKQDEIRAIEREMEDLKADRKKCDEILEGKERDIERLNNEHHAILLQLQEIGDLQAAVKMKHDYRKLQFQLSQTNKQYQEAVSEKLQFQKQVEKLRQAFLGIFPFANAAPQNVVQSSSAGGYSSFPMRTCRRQHHNQYPFSDPAPPTPPGLIARGDHHGSLVEKDEHSLPSQAIHVPVPKQHHTMDGHVKPTMIRSPDTLELQMWPSRPSSSHDGHVTATTAKLHDYQRHSTSSSSSSGNTGGSHGSHMTRHQLVVPDNVQPFTHNMHTRPSSSNSTYDSSRPYLTTSDYSSSKSLPQYAVQPATSSSQQTSFTGYSSTHTTSSGLSSSSATTHNVVPPPMVATTTTSLVANYPTVPHHRAKNLTNGVIGSSNQSLQRPASLSINGGGMHTSPSHYQKGPNQQIFECPSCRKQFHHGPKEFDQWFEHIRYCENKP